VNDFSVVVVPPLVDEMHMPPRINISLQLHYHQFLLMQLVMKMKEAFMMSTNVKQ
jgi:hypothetical protein